MKRGGADPKDQGVDHVTPPNQQEWPPVGAFVSRTPLDPAVIDPLQDIISALVPHVDVRLSHDGTKVGFWADRSPDAQSSAARERGIDNVSLRPTFQFVLWITPSLFYTMTQHFWSTVPKQESHDGSTLHLEKFDANLQPGAMQFHVHGWVEGQNLVGIPLEPGFDFTQTALLFASNLHIESFVTNKIDVDAGIEALFKILLGHVPIVGPGLTAFAGTPTPGGFPNLAEAFLGRLPTQILIPGNQLKMMLQYESIRISAEDGILIEISDKLTDRSPRLHLTASHPTIAAEAQRVTVEVHWTANDLRNPHVEWQSEGSIERIDHGARITFTLPQPHPVLTTRRVHATATDADAGRATAHVDAEIGRAQDPSEPPHGHVPEPRRGRD